MRRCLGGSWPPRPRRLFPAAGSTKQVEEEESYQSLEAGEARDETCNCSRSRCCLLWSNWLDLSLQVRGHRLREGEGENLPVMRQEGSHTSAGQSADHKLSNCHSTPGLLLKGVLISCEVQTHLTQDCLGSSGGQDLGCLITRRRRNDPADGENQNQYGDTVRNSEG